MPILSSWISPLHVYSTFLDISLTCLFLFLDISHTCLLHLPWQSLLYIYFTFWISPKHFYNNSKEYFIIYFTFIVLVLFIFVFKDKSIHTEFSVWDMIPRRKKVCTINEIRVIDLPLERCTNLQYGLPDSPDLKPWHSRRMSSNCNKWNKEEKWNKQKCH